MSEQAHLAMSPSITNPNWHDGRTRSAGVSVDDVSITVTRSVKVWRSSYKTNMLLMSIPIDVAELAGIKDGDMLLIRANAEGQMTIVKADAITG
jgi:hypothetical protein